MQDNNQADITVGVSDTVIGLNKKTSLENARRCPQCAQADCLPACPLGIDIPGFIRHLRESDPLGAYQLIRQRNPFPQLCGHVCTAPCERSCIFYAEGKSIEIRALELYASQAGSKGYKVNTKLPINKKVAIIGSGIAGLMAAYELAVEGVGVDLLEANQQPGGLLRYAIPSGRLGQTVIDDMVAELQQLGVNIEYGAVFGRTVTLPELYLKGYDAMVLALGASLPKFMDGLDDHLSGLYYNIDFLHRSLAQGKSRMLDEAKFLLKGASTVVIASGGDGFDAARLARQAGQQVHVLLLQASILDNNRPLIDQLKQQGITVESAASIDQWIEGENHDVLGVMYTDISGQKCQHDAQTVILALGQGQNHLLKDYLPQLRCLDNGMVWVDPQTRQTSIEQLYACGSLVTGVHSVVDIMADSRIMAQAIIQQLKRSNS